MNSHSFTARPRTEASRSHLKVLLVDDHAVFLDSAETFLSSNPAIEIVGRASCGLDAIRLSRELSPDLILMDIAMPRMNGLEVTRRIKAGSDAPRIVLLTLHDTPEYRASARDAGADGFVPKREFVECLPPVISELFA